MFGLIAQVGFGFHILLEYAAWGLVLLLIRRWSTPAVLATASWRPRLGRSPPQ